MEEVTCAELDIGRAIIIGYMMGTYEVMGRGGAQAVANIAGEFAGREMARFAESREIQLDTWDDIQRFLTDTGLADCIDHERTDTGMDVEIRECRICPRRAGHRDFPGTVCPWGGLLAGLLGQLSGARLTSTHRLDPGETCTISLASK